MMKMMGRDFTFEELMQLGNPVDIWGETPAYRMAKYGHKFTVDQILALGDSTGKKDIVISLMMAQHGHPFTFDEIIRLKNPADYFGATLAHWMAMYKHVFSVDEILQLGNPVISYSENDFVEQYVDDICREQAEEVEYKLKKHVSHNGATIAHIMAREGYKFSAEEIEALGNPKDRAGLTIADWMERAGNFPGN